MVRKSGQNGAKRKKLPKRRVTVLQALDLIEEVEGKRLSEVGLRKFCSSNGIGIGKDHRVSVSKLLGAREQIKARARAEAVPGSLKDQKLELDIEILRIKRDEMLGKLISYEDHLSELRVYAGIVNGVFEQWVSQVSALTRDKKLVAGAEELMQRAMSQLCSEIGGVDES